MPGFGINIGNRIDDSAGGPSIPVPIALGASLFVTVDPAFNTSDAGHTTPCVDGSSITSWYEQATKTWVNWVSFNATVKPVFNVVTGKYNASFTNGTFQFPGALIQGDVSFCMRFTPQTAGNMIGSANSGNVPYNFYRALATGPVQRYNTGPSIALTNGVDTILSYYGTGTGVGSVEKIRTGQGAWTTVNNNRPTTAGISTTLDLGFGAAGNINMTNFKGMVILPRGASDSDITACENVLLAL